MKTMVMAAFFLLASTAIQSQTQTPTVPVLTVRKPPSDWLKDYKSYRKHLARLQKAQDDYQHKHQKESDLADGMQRRLAGGIPQGMSFDETIGMFVPSTPAPMTAPAKPEAKP